jgi:hypothetical protein
MTQDAEGTGPQDPPPPPTRTQWSQDQTIDEGGLLPPFVPGQRRPDADQQAGLDSGNAVLETSDAGTGAGDQPTGNSDVVDAHRGEPDVGAPRGDDSFPFDISIDDEAAPFYGWPTTDSSDESARSGDGNDEAFADLELESLEAPVGSAGQEGAEVQELEVQEFEVQEFEVQEFEVQEFEVQEFEVHGSEAHESEFLEAELREAEGQEAEVDNAGVDFVKAAQEENGDVSQWELGAGDPLADIASHLESLADRIRAEGRSGIEREMASLDRFSSLIAGVVAGYLAGLRE